MSTAKNIFKAAAIATMALALSGCLALSKGVPETIAPPKKEPGKGYQTFGSQPYPEDDNSGGNGGH